MASGPCTIRLLWSSLVSHIFFQWLSGQLRSRHLRVHGFKPFSIRLLWSSLTSHIFFQFVSGQLCCGHLRIPHTPETPNTFPQRGCFRVKLRTQHQAEEFLSGFSHFKNQCLFKMASSRERNSSATWPMKTYCFCVTHFGAWDGMLQKRYFSWDILRRNFHWQLFQCIRTSRPTC